MKLPVEFYIFELTYIFFKQKLKSFFHEDHSNMQPYRANYDMLRYVLDHSAAKRFRLAGLGLKGESNLLSLGRTSERVRKYFKLKFQQNNCCKV